MGHAGRGLVRARGDWEPRKDTFPDDTLQKVVKAYHDNGINITLWWIPLVVEDGHGKDILNHRPYQLSKVVKDHPDWLILGKDGKPARATADLGALCPAVPEVQQYYKQLTERFIHDWDFDGHKLDFSYTVPACYNPKHHHKSPNDSIAAVGDVYKVTSKLRAIRGGKRTRGGPSSSPPTIPGSSPARRCPPRVTRSDRSQQSVRSVYRDTRWSSEPCADALFHREQAQVAEVNVISVRWLAYASLRHPVEAHPFRSRSASRP